MADDVVFLTPGREPFGKAEFAAASRGHKQVRFEGHSDVREIRISGDVVAVDVQRMRQAELATAWSKIEVTITPVSGGLPKRLAGNALSVFQRQADGRWLLVHDANLLKPIELG
jgi:uncharacterized protein (TIGR02246 family)